MSFLKVQLLGAFEASHAELNIISFPRRKATALLAYLCLEQPGKAHQRDTLATLLWPDTLQEDARRNLRQCLYQLRQTLGDHDKTEQVHLEVTAQTVRLRTEELFCDATNFLQRAKSDDPIQLEAALQLHRGEMLAGFNIEDAPPFEEWLFYTREQVARNLTHVLQRLRTFAAEKADWPRAIAALSRLIALDPLSEELHLNLMQAYFANGDRKAALDQYVVCREILETELGLPPQPEITALYQRIKTAPLPVAPSSLDIESLFAQPPPLKPASSQAVNLSSHLNLPVVLTSFVGREAEIQTIKNLLAQPDVRLVTLSGPGGSGKTRLSLQIAADLAPSFERGVAFVPLDTLQDPALVAEAISKKFGLPESGPDETLPHLKAHLAPQHLLLVLDNFEQVIAASEMVAELLEAAPRLKIVVTSRVILRLYGEHQFVVPPLTMPNPQNLPPSPKAEEMADYAVIQLFYQRARATSANFALTDENIGSIAQICWLLDGMPLAIELAAAHSRLFSPKALLARLTNTTGSGSKLDLLAGGSRNLPRRQQALRATLDWSYELLRPTERILFQRLGVFMGGWTLEAAEGVCSDENLAKHEILWLLNDLIDKSLIVITVHEDEPRYRFLEIIRQYSLEKLQKGGESADWHRRHQTYFMRLAEDTELKLQGSQQIYWLQKLEVEHANLRVALDWGSSPQAGLEARTATLYTALALWEFWYIRGYYNEARQRLQNLLSQLEGTELENSVAYAWMLGRAGYFALKQADYEQGRALSQASLVLLQRWEDRAGVAFVLNSLGIIESDQGNYGQARVYFEEALAAARPTKDKRRVAMELNNLGEMSQLLKQYEAATAYFEESLALFREIGSVYLQAYVLNNLGTLVQQQAAYATAQTLQLQSLDLFYKVGDKRGVCYCLSGLASLAAQQGQVLQAACLLGIMEAMLASFAGVLDGSAVLQYNVALAAVQAAPDQTAINQFRHKGEAMTLEQGINYAKAITAQIL